MNTQNPTHIFIYSNFLKHSNLQSTSDSQEQTTRLPQPHLLHHSTHPLASPWFPTCDMLRCALLLVISSAQPWPPCPLRGCRGARYSNVVDAKTGFEMTSSVIMCHRACMESGVLTQQAQKTCDASSIAHLAPEVCHVSRPDCTCLEARETLLLTRKRFDWIHSYIMHTSKTIGHH
jgi:hypothetical protein